MGVTNDRLVSMDTGNEVFRGEAEKCRLQLHFFWRLQTAIVSEKEVCGFIVVVGFANASLEIGLLGYIFCRSSILYR
jgi:hypothetical protein